MGAHRKDIVKTTREKILEFLSSDDAMMVYSNSQQIFAMAKHKGGYLHLWMRGRVLVRGISGSGDV